MIVEREIAEIKARLDRIEVFLTGGTGSVLSNASEAAYELLDLQVKKSQSMIGPEYAYRVKVKNSSDMVLRFGGSIVFVDSAGFEVYRHTMNVFAIQAGQTHTASGKATILDANHVPRIADVTAEIYTI